MQDNDPKHTSVYAKEFMESHQINWWKTLTESPDLNPIENLWHEMKEYNRREVKPMMKEQFYLICLSDEDNTMSVVPGHKIISPSVEERVPGSFCKIKRFEKHLSKIEATGTEAEMNKRLHKEANSEPDETEHPRKKALQKGE